jgi:hypothetical protein
VREGLTDHVELSGRIASAYTACWTAEPLYNTNNISMTLTSPNTKHEKKKKHKEKRREAKTKQKKRG